ncbi:hypothetical protein M8J75_003716 [Diaphorina citri]|nr:hypothetical protein M8J75_003716 [Diaphorina citri]
MNNGCDKRMQLWRIRPVVRESGRILDKLSTLTLRLEGVKKLDLSFTFIIISTVPSVTSKSVISNYNLISI